MIVLDIETTGINPQYNKITEIGAIKVENNKVIDKFNQLVNPEITIPKNIIDITGITNEMVANKPSIEKVLPEFIKFCDNNVIVGHNIRFDYSFIKMNAIRMNLTYERKGIDTLKIARILLGDLPSKKLGCLCSHYNIDYLNGHRAFNDAYATFELFNRLKEDHYETTPELFRAKAIHWKPKKESPITIKQSKFLLDLIKKYNIMVEYRIEELSKSQASRAIDNIIRTYGKAN